MKNNYIVMEYLYRDASNFKAWGKVLLKGGISNKEIKVFISCLDFGKFFIAEQIGVPTLYRELWEYSNGPTVADHAFHEFSELRPATDEEKTSMVLWGETTVLLQKVKFAAQSWDCSKSVHSEICYS